MPQATNNAGPRDEALVDRVARAMRTFAVVGVVYADDAGSCYRVMQGSVVNGGDYVDDTEAQNACDLLNAEAAIAAMSRSKQPQPDEPTEAMIEAGAALIGGGSTFDHEERREMAEEIYLAMRAATPTEQPPASDEMLDVVKAMKLIHVAVEEYRNAPFKSADWLAGQLMLIFDKEPAALKEQRDGR